MIKSMTGFGRAHEKIDDLDITVEIKSVNHRYFEFSSRVPRNCSFLEEKLKAFVKDKISRGKVEAYVSILSENSDAVEVSIDREYADAYVKALHSLSEIYGATDDITASVIAENKDVFCINKKEIDEDYISASVLNVVGSALDAFIKMRETEGEKLKNDVLSRADYILNQVEIIEKRSPETVLLYQNRLEEKIKELLGDTQIDEQRILTEVALFADKIAVAEETVRLRSHIDQLHKLLSGDDAVGRKLDFLIQEMNREINTIGSKAQDIEISHIVVDVKAEIEKIREQIQNIE